MDESGQILYKVLSSLGGADGDLQKADDSTVPLSQLCRICALPNEYLIPIFEGEGQENNLADRIHSHLPIRVNNLDDYPDHVCYQCASTLLAFHDLVDCCTQADITLSARVQLGQSKKTFTKELNQSKQDVTQSNKERFQGLVKALEDKNVKNITLVDGDGLNFKHSLKIQGITNKKSFHTCCRCNKIFCNPILFARHLRHCESKTYFKCRKCEDKFSSKDSLLTHLKSCLEFYCWHCKKQFISRASLKIHFLSKHFLGNDIFVHSKHDFECEFCSDVFYDSVTNVSKCYSKYKNIICNSCEEIKKSCTLNVTLDFYESEPVMDNKLMLSRPNDNIVIDDNLQSPTPGVSPVKLNNVNLPSNKAYKRKVDPHLITKNVTEDYNALTKYESKIDELFHFESRKFHTNKTFCIICENPKEFKTYQHLNRHFIKDHGLIKILYTPKDKVCEFCVLRVNSLITMGNHFYKSHIPYLKCDHCDILLSSFIEKSLHMKKVHPQLGRLCIHCPFVVSNISAQEKKDHTFWHRFKEPLTCDTCSKVLKGREKLRSHLNNHTLQMEEPRLCPICGKFVRHLYSHLYKHQEGMILCLTCGKLIPKNKYSGHLNTKYCRSAFRNPPKPKQCSYCGKIFSDYKREFQHRRLVHEKHLYLPCNYCIKTFPFGFELTRHVKKFHRKFIYDEPPPTIMNETTAQSRSPRKITAKPPPTTFSCHQCTELFKTQIQLANHLRIRHGIVERKYKCQYCSKAFIRKDALEAHLRIHTGERPYSCQVCGQRFRQAGDRQRHQARHGVSSPPEQRVNRKKSAIAQLAREEPADDEIHSRTLQIDVPDMENARAKEMHFSREKHSGGKVSERSLQRHIRDPEIVRKRERQRERHFTKKHKFVREMEIENPVSKKSGGKVFQPYFLYDMPDLDNPS